MSALLALALLTPSVATGAPQDEAPSRREQEELVAEYFALDRIADDGRARGRAILARLAPVPFPDARGLRRWEKTFARVRKELPRLPTGRGEHWEWEAEGRGRYFVDGQVKKPKGLFVGMHGGGVGSGDAASSRGAYADAAGGRGWLCLFPEVLEKTERGWTDAGTEEWVLSLVERALRTFDVPPDHVYLGGHSMGGYGSWVLGAHHADRVAALAPSAGAPTPVYGRDGQVRSIQRGVVPSLRNVPMCVFQSTDDPRVPPDANQAAVAEVERARERYGGYEDFEYWEVGDRGHGFPEGGAGALLERIEGYARDPRPAEVLWQPALPWKEQFYWLLWEEPRLGAIVEASVDRDAGRVDVLLQATDGEGLAVLLCAELVDMERELEVVVNGERAFLGVPEPDFATLVRTSVLDDPGRRYVARVPLR